MQYALTGLGSGAAIAALALGLVLTFRASNVVNIAHGAIGMYGAYVYYGLRNFKLSGTDLGGDLVLPIIGLPAKVHVLDRPTALFALLIALLMAALVGAILYALVFRPLRSAPPLARIIASLGVFLYLQSVMNLRTTGQAGAASFQLRSLLPKSAIAFGDARVPTSSFILTAIVAAVALTLGAVFRYTRFGLATRAASEHERGAVLTGLSPDRLGYINWIIASVVAVLAVILIAGVQSKLDPTETSLLVVPALAAALLGRLDGFAMTTAAGLVIGMTQGGLGHFQDQTAWLPDWLPSGGLAQALPVVVILVAITARGAKLPSREAILEGRLPFSPVPRHPAIASAGLAAGLMVLLWTTDAQWRLAIVVSTIAALIALSCVVLTGYVGQISLAQYAFAGLAAFTTAKLNLAGIPFPFAPLLAVAITVVVGIITGIPGVRVRGMTLAVATIGAAVAIEQLALASPSFIGLDPLPRPRLFGIDLGFSSTGADNFRPEFGALCVVVFAVALIVVANLRRSPTGLRWLAVRGNERAAAAAGVDVAATKLSAFALSSLLAGLGGTLIAYQSPALSPTQFMVVGALAVLALTYLGGVASLSGALVAGLLASGGILTQLQGGVSGNSSKFQFALSGVMLIAIAVLYPDGVVAGMRSLGSRVRTTLRTRTSVDALGRKATP